MTPTTPIPAVTCAENIALLHLLHSVPAPPSANPRNHLPIRDKGYALDSERERGLTGTLAFLSNITDDPNHIPAVCVEEDPNSVSLNVLLAVNRVKHQENDGNQVLRELEQGFERIFTVLSHVSDGGRTQSVESDVFNAIVSVCSARIRRRLRFISDSRNKPKQPIRELLQEAMTSVEELEDKKLRKLLPVAKLFVERAKEVTKLADSWTKHQTTPRLQVLVEAVHRLWQVEELHILFDAIPNRAMDPSSRRNLLSIVGKVARYREAARFLYRTAKKFPSVQQMKIVIVDLPESAFEIPGEQYTPALLSIISRIGIQDGQWDLGHICRLLNTTELEASNQFAQRTKRTLKKAKIHAEIQLLFYCELKTSKLPPRVICSSKDACFLCNAFISMHGKMHMPRSHGRLYPGWRLPLLPKFNEMEQRFNQVLENYIKDSLRVLLLRKQKTAYPDPNESTLLTLPFSASTLRSTTLSDNVEDIDVMKRQQTVRSNHSTTSGSQISSMLSENINITRCAAQIEGTIPELEPAKEGELEVEELKVQPSNGIKFQSAPSILSSISSNSAFDDNSELIQGRMLSRSVKVNQKTNLYNAGSLEIQLEYSTERSEMISNSTPRKLAYGIKWLTVEEMEMLQENQATSIIDAEAIYGEMSYEVDEMNCLYITGRGSTLKILLYPAIT